MLSPTISFQARTITYVNLQ